MAPREDQIAIIGCAANLSGAPDLDALWRLILSGTVSSRPLKPAEARQRGVSEATLADPSFVPLANDLAGYRAFDHAFFGFSEREAQIMDPQRRLLFQTVQHAFDNAGQDPSRVRTGAWLSTSQSEYFLLNLASNPDLFASLGGMMLAAFNGQDFAATQIAYKLDLRGPALNVNTACSSSLVAVHQAVAALLAGECELAIAGGASLALSQEHGYWFREGGISSRSGVCRPFGRRADGTLSGSGAAALVLKRLDDAIADGDPVRAVILGTAINNDGRRKVGYTAPSVEGQAEVIAEALAVAGLCADDVDYLETHGTGTSLGDAIELSGIGQVYGARRGASPLALGSLKANVGHCNAAAGAAALIKVVLMLEHETVPPLAGFEAPHPNTPVEAALLDFPTTARAWSRSDRPRVAGVSSYGIGGTNAHVVVAEAPARDPALPSARPIILPISAAEPDRLAAVRAAVATHLTRPSAPALADLAFSIADVRRAERWRVAPVSTTPAAAAEQLAAATPVEAGEPLPTALLIAGQGEPIAAAFQALHRQESVFRDAVAACRGVLADMDADLPAIDWEGLIAGEADDARLRPTQIQQIVLFVHHYAMSRLWTHWCGAPHCVLGHSHGELVAAHLAGAVTLGSALRLAAARGRAMQSLPPGGMLAVLCDAGTAAELVEVSGCAIAAVNGPMAFVLSGPLDAVARAVVECQARALTCQRLALDAAFHTAAVEPALGALREALSEIVFTPTRVSLVSNLSGTVLPAGHLFEPDYWIEHARRPVLFSDGLRALATAGPFRIVEIGARGTLTKLASRSGTLASGNRLVVAADDALDRMSYRRLAAFWADGGVVDWTAVHDGEPRRRAPLPPYPFAATEHWIDRKPLAAAPGGVVEDWLYRPVLEPRRIDAVTVPKGDWLLVGAASRIPAGLAEVIAAAGGRAILINWADGGGLLEAAASIRGCGAEPQVLMWFADDRIEPVEASIASLIELADSLLRPLTAASTLTFALVMPTRSADDAIGAARDAALAAVLRVLPQEIAGLRTRAIFRAPEASVERLCAVLGGPRAYDEFHIEGTEVRGTGFRPAEAASGHGIEIGDGAHLLIVGGLGRVGRILTRGLATSGPMEAILVGRSPVLPVEGVGLVDLTGSDRAAGVTAAMLSAAPPGAPPEHDDAETLAAHDLLRRLCARLVLDYVRSTGIDLEPGARLELASLAQATCRVPELARIGAAFARTLVEAGVAGRVDGGIVILPTIDALDEVEPCLERLRREHPDFVGLAMRAIRCGAHFGAVCREGEPGNAVLYPDGSPEFLKQTAPGPKAAEAFDRAVAELIAVLRRRAEARRGRPLRILEAGAGTGSLTTRLIAGLQDLDLSYCFTDISPAFLQQARERARAAGIQSIEIRRLDIERDPLEQGLGCGEFDCVVGFNVLHIASDVAEAVQRISPLLRPDGMLALIETVVWQPWLELVWGLNHDWWGYSDPELRGDGPLLSRDCWTALLKRLGFASVASRGRETDGDALILAAGPSDELVRRALAASRPQQERRAHLAELARLGSRLTYVRADLSEQTQAAELARLLAGRGLDGIFYAATSGARSLGLIGELSGRAIAAECRAKTDGLVAIDAIAEATRARFVAVISSMSAVLGGIGHAAYAAANAWQDAYAVARDGAVKWLSINWDAWSNAEQSVGASVLEHLLSETEAMAALRAALRTESAGHLLVSRKDLGERLRTWLWRDVGPAPAQADGPQPASGAETVLAELWRELLGAGASIAPDANFFAAGGDSLLAIRLLSQIKTRLGRTLSISDLSAEPTFAGIAARLRTAQSTWSPLVTFNEGGSQIPLYCVHPGGGGIQCYRALVDALSADIPLHAIRSYRDAPEEMRLHETVEDMARDYALAIRRFHRGGPLILLGYCFGGMIAFETAAALAAAGIAVDRLILVDSHAPGTDDGFFDESAFVASQLAGIGAGPELIAQAREIASWSPAEQARFVVDRIDGLTDEAETRNGARRMVEQMVLFNKAKNKYVPSGRLNCPTHLIRIDDSSFHTMMNDVPDLGWQRLFSATIDITMIDGTHANLFEPGQVEAIAAEIERIVQCACAEHKNFEEPINLEVR